MENDFFEQALVKVKDAFDVAYKKTGEVVNVQRQKFEVTSLNGKIEKDYAELGKIFFEQIKDSEDMPENVSVLVSAISEKKEKISSLNLEIAQTQKKKICPNCKAVMEQNASFCSACGVAFSEQDESVEDAQSEENDG